MLQLELPSKPITHGLETISRRSKKSAIERTGRVISLNTLFKDLKIPTFLKKMLFKNFNHFRKSNQLKRRVLFPISSTLKFFYTALSS